MIDVYGEPGGVTVSIQKVENGYIVRCGQRSFIASTLATALASAGELLEAPIKSIEDKAREVFGMGPEFGKMAEELVRRQLDELKGGEEWKDKG